MPGNLIGSTPNGVMPASLCTAFSELREYAQLQNQFHDGTIQRSQLAQTSRPNVPSQQKTEFIAAVCAVQLLGFPERRVDAVCFLQSVRCHVRPADWEQLRSDGQQYAGPRDGGVPWQLGASDRSRADERAGPGTGGGGVDGAAP